MELSEKELFRIIDYFRNIEAENNNNTYELEIEIMQKLSYIENRLDELSGNSFDNLD